MWSNMTIGRNDDEYNAGRHNVNTVLIFHNNFTDRDTIGQVKQPHLDKWISRYSISQI